MRSDMMAMAMEKGDGAFVVDVLMGLLARELPAGAVPAMAMDARIAADGCGDWADAATRGSLVVEAIVLDGLRRVRPASDVLADCLAALAGVRMGVVPPLPAAWACPDCSQSGRVVLLEHADGGFACPVCGCFTTSPVDDACLPVDDDGIGLPCVPWAMAMATGMDASALAAAAVDESAAASACDEAGDALGGLRHSVRLEVFDSIALGRSLDELPGRVGLAESDWRDWLAESGDGDGLPACPVCPAGCAACCRRAVRLDDGSQGATYSSPCDGSQGGR